MKHVLITDRCRIGRETPLSAAVKELQRMGSPAFALDLDEPSGEKVACFIVRGGDLAAHMHEALAAYGEE